MTKKIIILALLAAAAAGCAKETTMSTGELAKAYLDLWIQEYQPGLVPNASGIYIMEETVGTGDLRDSEKPYAYIRTTVRTLDGTISSTSDEELSKQLGTYEKGAYYGPRYSNTGEGISYAGTDALMEGMRIGGTRKALIPAWMLTAERYSTQKEYIDNATSTTHLIYTITLDGQVADVEAAELDSLTCYIGRHYPGAVSVSYDEDTEADGTFYFFPEEGEGEEVELSSSVTGTINYTGRLLNGQVFDTTDEITAKDAGIYSASKTYEPVEITFADSWKEIKMGESSSLIDGFKGGLSLMKHVGQKATVIFTSKHGYDSSGSGSSIPGWSPLIFEIELVSLSTLD